MDLELRAFDAAEYLDDAESVATYLEDALEDDDPGEFLEALGVLARAKGMTDVAREAGVTRPALYRSLRSTGHPDFATVLSVLRSLGVDVRLSAASTPRADVKGAAVKASEASSAVAVTQSER